MTEFYPSDSQQTQLTESSTLLNNPAMPSFYPASTRHRTVLTKQLTDRDDDDHDSIYKEAFIVQVFQHWKVKTIEHQQAPNHFSQAVQETQLTEPISSTEYISYSHPSAETRHDEIIPPSQPALQKRATPLRRRDPLKRAISAPTDPSNPNLLAPSTKSKTRSNGAKKPSKPAPIFIAPKKTPPSLIFPRTHALSCSDESNAIKPRTIDDDHPISVSPTWSPTPPLTPIDDEDGTSSDDNNESLFIRNRKAKQRPVRPREKYILPSHVIIPALFIVDPQGHAHPFDAQREQLEDAPDAEEILEKYTLHSIGEEDEESIEKTNPNGSILSKELNRIEAQTRSRRTTPEIEKVEPSEENSALPLGRRWSDGGVSDEEDRPSSPGASLVKMASATSVVKPAAHPPTKISRTKYLLMKLHLTSSSKEEESTAAAPNPPLPPARKRTVRRSADKKRYQTH